MQTGNKVLRIDYEKCTGCRLCELVCSVRHDHVSNPERSRIRVIKWEAEGVYVPMTCQQCEDAPCVNACPAKALARNQELGRVEIDYDVCIGCRTCVSVCPFGAMNFIASDRRVTKCDLCDGDPQCVRFCEVEAIEFIPASEVGHDKRRKAARRLQQSEGKATALLADA
jgi:anaerobic carbon-monoxide dehydrogenase iron sulfur subunit